MWTAALALLLCASPDPAALDRRLDEIARARDLPAGSAAVVADGKVLWTQAWGNRGDEPPQPVRPGDLFRIASITKTFTALGILQLRDAGKLNLDDPLSTWLSEARIRPALWGDREPTLRDVLLHRSGLPRSGHFDTPRDRTQSEERLVHDLDVKLESAPGEKEVYSNLGFSLLGMVIQRASNTPYREYMAEHLQKPLGVSTIWEDAEVPEDRRVRGRERDGEGGPWKLLDHPEPLRQLGAAGQMYASAPELARLVLLELGEFPDKPPVKSETVAESQKPGVPDIGGGGYGLSTRELHGVGAVVEKDGLLPGFASSMIFDPAKHVGVVVLVAGSGADVVGAAEDLLRAAEPR